MYTTKDPFKVLEDLFQDDFIRSAFDDLDKYWRHAQIKTTFPPSNVSTTKEGTMVMELALAGYAPEQISITAEDGRIIVVGKGKTEDEDCECFPLWKGIKGSGFKVAFPIPSKFDIAKAKATFKHGMMIIHVPLAEERKPKPIVINLNEDSQNTKTEV